MTTDWLGLTVRSVRDARRAIEAAGGGGSGVDALCKALEVWADSAVVPAEERAVPLACFTVWLQAEGQPSGQAGERWREREAAARLLRRVARSPLLLTRAGPPPLGRFLAALAGHSVRVRATGRAREGERALCEALAARLERLQLTRLEHELRQADDEALWRGEPPPRRQPLLRRLLHQRMRLLPPATAPDFALRLRESLAFVVRRLLPGAEWRPLLRPAEEERLLALARRCLPHAASSAAERQALELLLVLLAAQVRSRGAFASSAGGTQAERARTLDGWELACAARAQDARLLGPACMLVGAVARGCFLPAEEALAFLNSALQCAAPAALPQVLQGLADTWLAPPAQRLAEAALDLLDRWPAPASPALALRLFALLARAAPAPALDRLRAELEARLPDPLALHAACGLLSPSPSAATASGPLERRVAELCLARAGAVEVKGEAEEQAQAQVLLVACAHAMERVAGTLDPAEARRLTDPLAAALLQACCAPLLLVPPPAAVSEPPDSTAALQRALDQHRASGRTTNGPVLARALAALLRRQAPGARLRPLMERLDTLEEAMLARTALLPPGLLVEPRAADTSSLRLQAQLVPLAQAAALAAALVCRLAPPACPREGEAWLRAFAQLECGRVPGLRLQRLALESALDALHTAAQPALESMLGALLDWARARPTRMQLLLDALAVLAAALPADALRAHLLPAAFAQLHSELPALRRRAEALLATVVRMRSRSADCEQAAHEALPAYVTVLLASYPERAPVEAVAECLEALLRGSPGSPQPPAGFPPSRPAAASALPVTSQEAEEDAALVVLVLERVAQRAEELGLERGPGRSLLSLLMQATQACPPRALPALLGLLQHALLSMPAAALLPTLRFIYNLLAHSFDYTRKDALLSWYYALLREPPVRALLSSL